MNNFILGILFYFDVHARWGRRFVNNAVSITDGGAWRLDFVTGDKILSVNGDATDSYTEVATIISKAWKMQQLFQALIWLWNMMEQPKCDRYWEKVDGTYRIGISPILKTGFVDKIVGGFQKQVRRHS